MSLPLVSLTDPGMRLERLERNQEQTDHKLDELKKHTDDNIEEFKTFMSTFRGELRIHEANDTARMQQITDKIELLAANIDKLTNNMWKLMIVLVSALLGTEGLKQVIAPAHGSTISAPAPVPETP